MIMTRLPRNSWLAIVCLVCPNQQVARATEQPDALRWQMLIPKARQGSLTMSLSGMRSPDDPGLIAATLIERWRASAPINSIQLANTRVLSRSLGKALEIVELSPTAGGGTVATRSLIRPVVPHAAPVHDELAVRLMPDAPNPLLENRDGPVSLRTYVWLESGSATQTFNRLSAIVRVQGYKMQFSFAVPNGHQPGFDGDRAWAMRKSDSVVLFTASRRGEQTAVVMHRRVGEPPP